MKPRITIIGFSYRPSNRPQLWMCRHVGSAEGYGVTPSDALRQWLWLNGRAIA
jgi:hypothetical protein